MHESDQCPKTLVTREVRIAARTGPRRGQQRAACSCFSAEATRWGRPARLSQYAEIRPVRQGGRAVRDPDGLASASAIPQGLLARGGRSFATGPSRSPRPCRGGNGWRAAHETELEPEPEPGNHSKGVLCRQVLTSSQGTGRCHLATTPARERVFLAAAEDAINSVIFLVFCLFPRNGLMDVNNYQTIKASKCAIFYRSKSSNK